MRNRPVVLVGHVGGTRVVAKDLKTLTMLASKLMNHYNNTIDSMKVECKKDGKTESTFVLMRRNEIFPDNTIIRGKWR